jgi:hypothetical protein
VYFLVTSLSDFDIMEMLTSSNSWEEFSLLPLDERVERVGIIL